MRIASFALLSVILVPALAQAQINRAAVNRGPAPAMQRPSFSPPPMARPAPVARPVVEPRPAPLPAVRPGMIPQTRPVVPVRPAVPDVRPVARPLPAAGGLTRPGMIDRPTVVVPPRPGVPARPVVVNSNHFNAIAPAIYNPHRPYGNYFRPYAGNVYRPYGWANYGSGYVWGNYYAARYYRGWNSGYWNYFRFGPGFVPRPVPLGWLLPAEVAWNYFNPYYLQPPAVVPFVDYSQPLPPPADSVSEAPVETPLAATAPADDPAADEAANLFAAARELFQRGDYDGALKTIDSAIAKLPQDPTLHEFRAQTLFAMEKFQESAAAIYAVLAAGPGWDADTLFALYPNKLVYNRQLAALERFAAANPANGAMQFLLGYQYLTLGDKDKAIAAFDSAVRDEPKDEVSKALAENLRKPPPAP